MDLGENGAGSDDVVSMEIQDRHAVEDASIPAVVNVVCSIATWIPQHHSVVSSTNKQTRERLLWRTHKCDIPDPVNEVLATIQHFSLFELL